MSLGKWTAIFVAGIFICSFFFAAFNALVDPFGLFGDRIPVSYTHLDVYKRQIYPCPF